MPKIDLYWMPMSQPSRAVKALLVAGDVPHEDHILDLMKGEHKTEDMLKINPAGSVPFITVDGEPLYESAAILRYIAVKFPSCNKYYGESVEQKAMIDAGLDFNGTSLRGASMGSFAPIIFPRMAKKEPSPEVHAAAAVSYKKFLGCIAMMEGAFKARNYQYVAGDSISIADF
jgi:glutathione S-transferase